MPEIIDKIIYLQRISVTHTEIVWLKKLQQSLSVMEHPGIFSLLVWFPVCAEDP